MFPRAFDLSPQAKDFISKREAGLAEAINYYQAQPQDDLDNLIYLAFFLSLNNQRQLARETVIKAIELSKKQFINNVDARTDLHCEWRDFFEKYDQHHLAFITGQKMPVWGGSVRLQKIAEAALAWGILDEAKRVLYNSDQIHDEIMRGIIELQQGNLRKAVDLIALAAPRSQTHGFSYYLARLGYRNEYIASIDGPWTSYFAALFEKNRIKRLEQFVEISKAENVPCHLRVLAALALTEMDPASPEYFNHFIKIYNQVYLSTEPSFFPAVNSVEMNCVYAIAARFIHKQLISRGADIVEIEKYQNIVRGLLTHSPISHNVLLPFSIPFYLRNAFMEVVLDKDYWPTVPLTLAQTDELPLIKEQWFQLVVMGDRSGIEEDTRRNMAGQALCAETTIGKVINVPQSNLVGTPLNSGTKKKFVQYIEDNFFEEFLITGGLSESTRLALKKHIGDIGQHITKPVRDRLKKSLIEVIYENEKKSKEDNAENDKEKALLEKIVAEYAPVLKLMRENKFDEAKKIFLKKDAVSKVNNLLVADYFYKKNCYRLASFIYYDFLKWVWSVGSIPNSFFSGSQKMRGFYSAMFTHNLKEASDFLGLFSDALQLRDIYWYEIQQKSREIRNRSFKHEPQGIHRLVQLIDYSEIKAAIEKYKTIDFNLMHKDLAALLDATSGDIDQSQSKSEEISRELEAAKNLGITSFITVDYLTSAYANLGRIAILRNDFVKAHEYFEKLKDSISIGMEQRKMAYSPYGLGVFPFRIRALVNLGKLDDAKMITTQALKEAKITPFIALFAYVLIAKKDKDKIQGIDLRNHLNSLDLTKELSFAETAILMITYEHLGEKDKVKNLLRDSKVAPQHLLINEIAFCQAEYLNILTRNRYWPEKIEKDDVNEWGLKETKESYVAIVVKTENLDVGLQAISISLLGEIFAVARQGTRTSYTAGSLKDMLVALEKIIAANRAAGKEMKLLPSTRLAVLRLFEINPNFFAAIQYYYPSVYWICQGCKVQDFTLLSHKSTSRSAAVAARTEEQEQDQDKQENSMYGL